MAVREGRGGLPAFLSTRVNSRGKARGRDVPCFVSDLAQASYTRVSRDIAAALPRLTPLFLAFPWPVTPEQCPKPCPRQQSTGCGWPKDSNFPYTMMPGFRKTSVRSPSYTRIKEGVASHAYRKDLALLIGFTPGLQLNPHQSESDVTVPSSL